MTLQDDLSERPESAAELRERAAGAPRSGEIDVADVFDDAFVSEHTEFGTFDGLVAASPSPAESAAELELVPDGAWDAFIADHTDFDDEEAMVMAARDHWVATQLDIEE